MLVYILNILLIVVLYKIIYNSNISKKWFLILSLAYLFAISSFRHVTMGADYVHYVSAFRTISRTGTYYMEKGYVLFNYLVSKITSNYIGLAIAVNMMIFVPLYFFIQRFVNERDWGICVFIFCANPYMFIQSTFNALRQSCATGLILLGMIELFNTKHKKIIRALAYFALVLVAAQFHRISYIMLIVPLVFIIKWNQVYWFVALIISVILNWVGATSIGEFVATRLEFRLGYLNYDSSILNRPIYIIFIVSVIGYFIYHYSDFAKLEKEKKHIVDFFIFSLCFLLVSLPNDMFYRVYIIIAFCALPGIPMVCESVTHKHVKIRIKNENQLIKRLFVLYYLAFYIGYIGLLASNHNSQYIPFRFAFRI